MKVVNINKIEQSKINKAVRVLKAGGIVIFPTDTVYGIGALVSEKRAIKNIYAIKKRSFNKPLPILLANKKELGKFSRNISPLAQVLITKFWPGPLTLVLPVDKTCSFTKNKTLAFRIPQHRVALSLIRRTGPLATTSANISGANSARKIRDISKKMLKKVDFILDAGICPIGIESTVVAVRGKNIKILREGCISSQAIKEIIANV